MTKNKDNRKTDFFIVGNPKSGTTTLYNYLKHHPNIFLPHVKEVVFFATDFLIESDSFHNKQKFFPFRSLTAYQEFYSNANASQLLGDATPGNLYSSEAAKNIYQYNPNAKIIISLREPVSYLRSAHFQSLFSFQETEKDFLKALDLENDRKLGRSFSPQTMVPKFRFYSERVKYASHIKRYLDLFPIKNIKVVIFDDIVKNEKKVVRGIINFLGLDNNWEIPMFVHKNPSKSMIFPNVFKTIDIHELWKFGQRKLPSWIFNSLERIFYRFFTKKEEKPPISTEDLGNLKTKYFNDVKDTSELLKNNNLIDCDLLSLWSYEDIEKI